MKEESVPMKFYVKQPLAQANSTATSNGGFIHNNKDRYGVDAICGILQITASTCYRTLDLADNPEHRASEICKLACTGD